MRVPLFSWNTIYALLFRGIFSPNYWNIKIVRAAAEKIAILFCGSFEGHLFLGGLKCSYSLGTDLGWMNSWTLVCATVQELGRRTFIYPYTHMHRRLGIPENIYSHSWRGWERVICQNLEIHFPHHHNTFSYIPRTWESKSPVPPIRNVIPDKSYPIRCRGYIVGST
jgi:hypothetical protein